MNDTSAFDALQRKLAPLWASIKQFNQSEQTIVVVPSLSLDKACVSAMSAVMLGWRAMRCGDIRVAANVVDESGDRLRADEPLPASADTMVFDRPGTEPASPSSATRAYLLVQTDGAPPVQFDLGGPLISIGRASDNDVIVDDGLVSRHHCQLKLQHGAYSFADLGSRNGSSVNGEPVTEVALGPGDIIRIGATEIEFQVRG